MRYLQQILQVGKSLTQADFVPKKWNTNLVQNNFGILIVSQFTLYSKMKGTKPDFHDALEGGQAKILFDMFVEKIRSKYKPEKVHTGAFGEYMDVHIRNDGPVTLIWETDKPTPAKDSPAPPTEEISENS